MDFSVRSLHNKNYVWDEQAEIRLMKYLHLDYPLYGGSQILDLPSITDDLHKKLIDLLERENVKEFNKIRFTILDKILDISNLDFSKKNLSGIYLNGVIANHTNFASTDLSLSNFSQAALSQTDFTNSNLTDALFMYSNLEFAIFYKANLSRTIFTGANISNGILEDSVLNQTIFIDSNLRDAKVPKKIGNENVFIQFANIKKTLWEEMTEKLLYKDDNMRKRTIDMLITEALRLVDLNRLDEALIFLDQSLEIDPNHVMANYDKGFILHRLGRYDEALKFFNKTLDIKPNHINALIGKGGIFGDLAKYKEAMKWYNSFRNRT